MRTRQYIAFVTRFLPDRAPYDFDRNEAKATLQLTGLLRRSGQVLVADPRGPYKSAVVLTLGVNNLSNAATGTGWLNRKP